MWLTGIRRWHGIVKPCVSCGHTAGFWVRTHDASVVRRPWCLSCTALLDSAVVVITAFDREESAVEHHGPLLT
jgi:hypothetical protein